MEAYSSHMVVYLFWSSAVLIIYTYIGYPLLIYLYAHFFSQRWRRSAIQPRVSIVLAVHNGAEFLLTKLQQLTHLAYPDHLVDIIVVSDGSADETNQILEAFHNSRVTKVICHEHLGKAAALNLGMEKVSGDVVLFVDVRPIIEPSALRLLLSNFADPRVGCAAGTLILQEKGHDGGMKAVIGLYWRLEQWIRKSESAVDSLIGVYGGFYAARRALVKALPQGTINDDMLQALNITRQGYRVVYDDRARVYDIWPRTSGSEFNRKVRTLAGNFQLLKVAPWVVTLENRLLLQLVSHKMLRLLVPALLLILLVTSAILAPSSFWFRLILASQVSIYALAAIGRSEQVPALRRLTGPAYAFCMLNAACATALFKFLFTRGPLWKIWTDPRMATAKQNSQEIRV